MLSLVDRIENSTVSWRFIVCRFVCVTCPYAYTTTCLQEVYPISFIYLFLYAGEKLVPK